ncbi:MAG: protease inhibitor I9 family protein, partial [Thermoanaerobaculia bacterium]
MILTLCLLAATSALAQRDLDRSVRDWDGKFVGAAEPIPDQYIVVLKDDAVFAFHERQLPIAVNETARQVTAGYTARVERTYGHALKAFAVRMDEATASRMASDSRIAYIEQDGVMTAFTTQTNAPWGLDRID